MKKEPVTDLVDLNEITGESTALLSAELERNRLILSRELVEGLPLVNGGRMQLQQVILNLIRHATEAMFAIESRPRQLTIRTELEYGNRAPVC